MIHAWGHAILSMIIVLQVDQFWTVSARPTGSLAGQIIFLQKANNLGGASVTSLGVFTNWHVEANKSILYLTEYYWMIGDGRRTDGQNFTTY